MLQHPGRSLPRTCDCSAISTPSQKKALEIRNRAEMLYANGQQCISARQDCLACGVKIAVPGQKSCDLCRAHQEDACTVLAACIQLWSLQVKEFALEHLLQCNGPATNTFRACFEHAFGSRSTNEGRMSGAHQPYASFLGPCSFQNLILPSIAPSGRLQYSMNTPNKNGGKSSSSMMLFAPRYQGRVCSRWFYWVTSDHMEQELLFCAPTCAQSSGLRTLCWREYSH